MVDLFYDSFSCYATAQIPQRYNTVWEPAPGNTAITIAPTGGRRGDGALRINGAMAATTFVGRGGLPTGPLGIGFACITDAPYNELTATPLFAWRQGGTTQVDIVPVAGGLLRVTRNGTILGTGTTPIFGNTWHYIELRTVFHGSAGALILQLDGVVILSLSGINTSATGSAFADEFILGNSRVTGPGSYDRHWCDLYLVSNAALKGVRRIDARFPTADVASTGFTPSSGSDLYAMVDEATPDSDTTHIEATALNDYALFSFQPLPALTAPTIDGVQLSVWGENTEVGNRSVAAQCRSNGTDAYSGDIALTSSQYKYGHGIFVVDPDTGLAWADAAAVDNAALGAKVTV